MVREGFLDKVTSNLYLEKLSRILLGELREKRAYRVEGIACAMSGQKS